MNFFLTFSHPPIILNIVGVRKGSISLAGFFLEVNAHILEKATLLLCVYVGGIDSPPPCDP